MRDAIAEMLAGLPSDEGDFVGWGSRTRELVTCVAERGPRFIGELTREAISDPSLRSKCETHQLLDYLVLFDDPDTGIRLRLHVSTQDHLQRVHDHRFSFSSHVMRGRYDHCIYQPTVDPYSISAEDDAIRYQDRRHTDPAFSDKEQQELFRLQLRRAERPGACYTMHHTVSHTVFTAKDTVSLVARGPARKSRSFIYDRELRKLWWRFGRRDETGQRVSEKTMTPAKLDQVLANLKSLNVIE